MKVLLWHRLAGQTPEPDSPPPDEDVAVAETCGVGLQFMTRHTSVYCQQSALIGEGLDLTENCFTSGDIEVVRLREGGPAWTAGELNRTTVWASVAKYPSSANRRRAVEASDRVPRKS